MMEPEPNWTTSVEAEERARDLADYAALVLEWNSFYDDMLSENLRLCEDYRKLNKVLQNFSWPIP